MWGREIWGRKNCEGAKFGAQNTETHGGEGEGGCKILKAQSIWGAKSYRDVPGTTILTFISDLSKTY